MSGTEIHSAIWGSDSRIYSLSISPPYTHLTVNHKTNFVNPVNNVCTNAVESMWMRTKRKICAANVSSAALMLGYLKEFPLRLEKHEIYTGELG